MSRHTTGGGSTRCLAIVALVLACSLLPLTSHAEVLEHSPAMKFAQVAGETYESLKEDTAKTWSSLPAAASLAGEFARDVWCGMIGLVGFSCEKEPLVIPAVPAPGTMIVTTTIPPSPKEMPQYTASTTPEGRVVYTTVIEEHNTYVTNPTTIIRESSGGGGSSDGVSRDLFRRQIDVVFENVSRTVDAVRDDIAEAMTTAVLTVTGNATVGGNLDVDGTLTAGSLSVSSVSSGGAVEAPYFTATSSTASTFPYASTTAISVSGTASTTNLNAQTATVGNITITTISVTSTLDTQELTATRSTTTNATTTNFFATNASTTNATSTNLFTNNFRLGSLTGFLKATAGAVATALVNLASDVTGILAVANGGTGWSNLQANSILLGNGTGAIATTTVGTNGQVLALVSGVPTWVATTTAGTGLTYSGGAFSVNTTQNISTLSNLTSDGIVYTSGSNGTLNIDSGALDAARGGTGATSFTDNRILTGNGTSAINDEANLTFDGSLLTLVGNASTTAISSSYASSTSGFFGSLSIGSLTGVLKATAGAISAAAVNLASEVSGVLAVANGGTGWANIANGFIPYGNGGSALATSSALSFDGTKFITTYASTTALTVSGSTYLATVGGNVGIGTTTPQQKLSVSTSGAVPLILDTTGGGSAGIQFTQGGVSKGYWGYLHTGSNGIGMTSADNNNVRLLITDAGNVGIGTTTPGTKLNIAGGGLSIEGDSAGNFSSPSNGLHLSFNTTSNTGRLLSLQNGVAWRALQIDGSSVVFNTQSGGNVGIGTTTPDFPLTITSGGSAHLKLNTTGGVNPWHISVVSSDGRFAIGEPSIAERLTIIKTSGNVGIGTTTPGSATKLAVNGTIQSESTNGFASMQLIDWDGTSYRQSLDNAGALFLQSSSDAFASNATTLMTFKNSNVGIGTTSPWRTLSVTGTVGFDGLTGAVGAGSLCLSANKEVTYNSGSDNCLSSTRATKHDIESLSVDALDVVNALQPVSFVYNGTERTRYGFIAEDTAAIDGILATYNDHGDLTGIDDRSILSVVVRAFQELYSAVMSRFEAQDANNTGQAAAIEALEARIEELEAREGIASPTPPEETPDEEDTTDDDSLENPPTELPDESLGGGEIPSDPEEELNAPDNGETETPEPENTDDGEASEPSPEPPPSE